MKRLINGILFGRNPIFSGIIALFVVGAVVLGCTCNDEEGFNWGAPNSSDSETTERIDREDDEPTRKADASKGEIPGDREIEEMVKETLMEFDRALKNEDFGDFYDSISKAWQRETSPRRLKKLFQKFIDGRADLSSIRAMDMELTEEPDIRESVGYEMLEVEGRFETRPNPTTFTLKYIAEKKDWKLSAISVVTGLKRGR